MIGKRPNRLAFAGTSVALGAEIQESEPDGTSLHAQTAGLRGAEIIFPFPSVGAVENACLPLWQRWGGRFCGDARGNRRLDSCAIS